MREKVTQTEVKREKKEKEKRRKKRKEREKRKEGKREKRKEVKREVLFFASCFGHKIVFFFGEKTHVASSRSQRVSRVVVVVLLLRVNVLMQKLNIRESCELKQD